jgi:hypothetical protein
MGKNYGQHQGTCENKMANKNNAPQMQVTVQIVIFGKFVVIYYRERVSTLLSGKTNIITNVTKHELNLHNIPMINQFN